MVADDAQRAAAQERLRQRAARACAARDGLHANVFDSFAARGLVVACRSDEMDLVAGTREALQGQRQRETAAVPDGHGSFVATHRIRMRRESARKTKTLRKTG